MKYQKLFICLSLIYCFVLIPALLLFNAKPTLFIGAGADTLSYKMEFNKDKNKFFSSSGSGTYSGNALPITNLGNKKEFYCKDIKNVSSSWQILANDGYFYNVDPIHGIKNISLTFLTNSANYAISYSKDNSFDASITLTTPEDGSVQTFDFDNFLPSYFKITNTSGYDLNISSLIINFSCLNNYPTLTLLNENEDMGSVSGGGIKTAFTSVTIKATPKDGYTFVGWYEGETLISSACQYTFNMNNDDVTYSARFAKDSYNVEVTSENEDYGSVACSGTYEYLKEVTIEATAKDECSFKGWYDANDKFVSKLNPYTFKMPASNVSYVAKFMSKEEQETWNKNHGVVPVEDTSTKTVTYGLYPQTHVSDASLVGELNKLDETAIDEQNGYYFYDNEYYVKLTANLSATNYTFLDGSSINQGANYWFKCEPIVWKKLNKSVSYQYDLVSTVLLDRQIFDTIDNDYETSYIRDWLTTDFYKSAFGLNDSYLTTTSAHNTDAEEIASDKVYLLSKLNYTSISSGDFNAESRKCQVTDYTIANHAYYDTDNHNGYYWTRTAKSDDSKWVFRIEAKGNIGDNDFTEVDDDDISVRPGITIKP